jgi:hypothetical protein
MTHKAPASATKLPSGKLINLYCFSYSVLAVRYGRHSISSIADGHSGLHLHQISSEDRPQAHSATQWIAFSKFLRKLSYHNCNFLWLIPTALLSLNFYLVHTDDASSATTYQLMHRCSTITQMEKQIKFLEQTECHEIVGIELKPGASELDGSHFIRNITTYSLLTF